MSTPDDRAWKAEDLLRTVVAERPGSTRDSIDRFFDELEGEGPPTKIDGSAATSDRPPDPPNHRLIRLLGAGGYGQVWLAYHELLNSYRACKLIPADKHLELEGLRRLKRQVPSHPHLFPIEDVGRQDDWLYCLMPLADQASTDHAVLDPSGYEALTLHAYLERHGRRPSDEVASIGADLAGALHHLHTHGVTHGDIKPANIMRLSGRWAIADYGLLRDISSPKGGAHTPGYIPPEGPGTAKADQYALGVVLMELLTGRLPETIGEFRQTPIDAYQLDAGADSIAAIIRRATGDDPDARFGSLGELQKALRGCMASPDAEEGNAGTRWRSVVLIVAVMIAAVGTLLLGILWQGGSSGSAAQSASTEQRDLIESFEVRRYFLPFFGSPNYGTASIAPESPAASVGDDVSVHAVFAEPAYCYLIALDADGSVVLRLPEDPDASPERVARLDYPSDPLADPEGPIYQLILGSGVQGFALIASRDPLPAWNEWIKTNGTPAWQRQVPGDAMWAFDGETVDDSSPTRAPGAPRARIVPGPIEWLRTIKQEQTADGVRLIAFPVRE